MTIEESRARIEEIDKEILQLIKERTDVAEQIGLIKKENGSEICVPAVEKKVIERYRSFAVSEGLDPDIMEKVCVCLMEQSKQRQDSL